MIFLEVLILVSWDLQCFQTSSTRKADTITKTKNTIPLSNRKRFLMSRLFSVILQTELTSMYLTFCITLFAVSFRKLKGVPFVNIKCCYEYLCICIILKYLSAYLIPITKYTYTIPVICYHQLCMLYVLTYSQVSTYFLA